MEVQISAGLKCFLQCPLPSPGALIQNDQRQIWWWNASKWLGNQEAVEGKKKCYCIFCNNITIKQHLQKFVRQKGLDISVSVFKLHINQALLMHLASFRASLDDSNSKKVPFLLISAAFKATTKRGKTSTLLQRAPSQS